MGEETFTNGSAAVIASTLGALGEKLDKITTEQAVQKDLLTRFDERQRGWATKHELSDATNTLQRAIDPVASQATSAHNRLDGIAGSMATLGRTIEGLHSKVDLLASRLDVKDAEVRGAWFVGKGAVMWAAGIVTAAISAYFIGHFT